MTAIHPATSGRAVIILMTSAAVVTWGFVHQVDVNCADWQIPFVTSVVNTYASWRAEFAAEVCPTAVSSTLDELPSVDVTSVG